MMMITLSTEWRKAKSTRRCDGTTRLSLDRDAGGNYAYHASLLHLSLEVMLDILMARMGGKLNASQPELIRTDIASMSLDSEIAGATNADEAPRAFEFNQSESIRVSWRSDLRRPWEQRIGMIFLVRGKQRRWFQSKKRRHSRPNRRKAYMNMIGRRIYPDQNAGGIAYEPEEWRMGDGPFLTHSPTSTMFEIGCNAKAVARNKATLFDFYACIVHVCDPYPFPDEDTIKFLGKGAIAVFLQATGAWKPTVVEEPDTPDQRRIKSNYPNQS